MKKVEYILFAWVCSVKKTEKPCRISLTAKHSSRWLKPKPRTSNRAARVSSRDILTFAVCGNTSILMSLLPLLHVRRGVNLIGPALRLSSGIQRLDVPLLVCVR